MAYARNILIMMFFLEILLFCALISFHIFHSWHCKDKNSIKQKEYKRKLDI
jgi:hypothetical protein